MFKKIVMVLTGVMAIGLSSCNEYSEPQSISQSSNTVERSVSENSELIAQLISTIPLTEEIVEEVFSATQQGLANGIDESCYFADVLENSAQSKFQNRSSVSALGRELQLALDNITRSNGDIDADLLINGEYQIYWPYSEIWDGVTRPVITFIPEDMDQLWNYAYRQTESGIETIIVDEEYMQSHPVWIINTADIPYDALPNFKKSEFVKNGFAYIPREQSTAMTSTTGEADQNKIYTVYLGKFKAEKQYDSVWNGGSEFAIQMGSLESFTITVPDQLKIYSTEITYLRITRSRNDIKNKKWIELGSSVLASDWQPYENNVGFSIHEEDQGGTKKWCAKLGITLDGKSYGFDAEIPYGSGDDLIYRTIYSRDFIFSSNNVEDNVPVVHYSGGVFWTLPYKEATVNI